MNAALGRLRPPEPPGKYASLMLAVIVHGLLAAFLIYGVRWQTTAPEAVEVEVVRAAPEPAEPPPQAPPEQAAPPPEPAPTPAKPDILLKDKEKPKPKPEPPPKPETPKSTLNPLAWLKNEVTQLAQRKAVEADMAKLNQRKASEEATARSKALADYQARIRGKIRGNIVLPPDIEGNPEAVFEITQLPDGEVLSARLVKTSGNGALDGAIERAILKSNPLPRAPEGLFERSITIKYRPHEE